MNHQNTPQANAQKDTCQGKKREIFDCEAVENRERPIGDVSASLPQDPVQTDDQSTETEKDSKESAARTAVPERVDEGEDFTEKTDGTPAGTVEPEPFLYGVIHDGEADYTDHRGEWGTTPLRMGGRSDADVREIVERAQRQADDILMKSAYEARDRLARADQEARAALHQAQQEAVAILARARHEEQEILAAAAKQADAVVQSARDEKARILEQARQAAADSAQEQKREILTEQLGTYFEDGAKQEEEARRKLDGEYQQLARERNELVRDMDDAAMQFQNTVAQSMDGAVREMQSIQLQMQQQLDAWRRGLYKAQYQDIALCFSNLDKILANLEKRLAAELAFGDEGYHPQLATELQGYVRNLKIFRQQLKDALSKMGIKEYYPCVGDSFNSFLHTVADLDPMTEANEDFNGKRITGCHTPGLMYVTPTGEQPLLTALVTVERPEKGRWKL